MLAWSFFISSHLTVLAQALLSSSYFNWPALCLLLFLYFVAFNILEASLPSLVSKQAPPGMKGTAWESIRLASF